MPPSGLRRASLSKLFAIVLDRDRGTQLGIALEGFKQSMTNISTANDYNFFLAIGASIAFVCSSI
jgi:hypothetical protein